VAVIDFIQNYSKIYIMERQPLKYLYDSPEEHSDEAEETTTDKITGSPPPDYSYLEPVKETLTELGFEEVEDDGWGFRVESGPNFRMS
jgi:hypothetical protein